MKVKELRDLLERAVDNLNDFDDDKEVIMVSNTYFLGYCHSFLGISGYNGGYINLDEISVEEDDESEEDD